MYCSKCGKQIEEGSKFCPYCGGTQDELFVQKEYADFPNNGIFLGMGAVDLVICGLYIAIMLWWIYTFFSKFSAIWQTVKYMEADTKFIGVLLYLIPFLLVFISCCAGVIDIKNKQYHISIGIIIAGIGVVVKIGSFIFSSYGTSTVQMILYYLFHIYGSIGISTMIMGVLITAILYIKVNGNQH